MCDYIVGASTLLLDMYVGYIVGGAAFLLYACSMGWIVHFLLITNNVADNKRENFLDMSKGKITCIDKEYIALYYNNAAKNTTEVFEFLKILLCMRLKDYFY